MWHGAGAWTLTTEHEKMIRSTQRKMLRLIIQARRKYKNTKKTRKEKDVRDDERSNSGSSTEHEDGASTYVGRDHDNNVCPMKAILKTTPADLMTNETTGLNTSNEAPVSRKKK